MKQKLVMMVCMVVFWVIAGCSSVKVSQDYDPRSPFPHQGTWMWRDQTQPLTGDIRIDNPLLDRRIRKAVEAGLEERNFHQQNKSPGFLLVYNLSVEPKIEAKTYDFMEHWDDCRHPWFGGMGRNVQVYQYDEGRLTLDILFSGTGDLLWRGTGIYRFNLDSKTPTEIDAEIQNLVNTILMQFPPTGNFPSR
ncbi:DUF4136 domain-containing protein [Desulfosarcina sp. OttesenSCG-928-A07]|nr:DUF4136 domain-containing protein [Desulfosarcina sp. OttesenSCG-928-A07]